MPALSPPRPLVILACFGSASLAQALHTSASRFGIVVRLNDRRLIRKHICARRPALVAFPLVDDRGIPTRPIVERVLRDAPDALTVICVPPGESTRGLASALQIGARLLTWANDAQMQPALEALLGTVTTEDFDQGEIDVILAELVPTTMTAVLRHCISLAHRRLSVGALASTLGVSRRTLNRATRRAGWPPPSELIAWGRVIRACAIRWRGGDSPASIARRAGFRDFEALELAVQRRVGGGATLADLSPLRLVRALQNAVPLPVAPDVVGRDL